MGIDEQYIQRFIICFNMNIVCKLCYFSYLTVKYINTPPHYMVCW